MTIREFFKMVVEKNIDLDCEMVAEIKGAGCFKAFADIYTDRNEVVISQYEAEPQEVDCDGRDEFFLALAEEAEKSEAEIAFDEMMGGMGEMLDAMKINGVR